LAAERLAQPPKPSLSLDPVVSASAAKRKILG
jgi:hypothetical protein